MFVAGSIVTKVSADLAPLRNAFNQARTMATGFAGSMNSALGSIGRQAIVPALAATAAAGVAVHRSIARVNEAFKGIDAAAKAADQIGMATEAYQAMSLAAELSGTNMEKVSAGVRNMQRGLIDATSGAGSAAEKFRQLGVDAGELVNLPAEQAMGKLGDALAKIENPAQRVSAAMEVFGAKAGPELLNLLSQGSEGMKAAAAEAERLGLTFSRTDAAKVEMANDAWAKAAKLVQGLAQTVSIELAPIVKALADRFTAAGAAASGGFRDRVQSAINIVVKGIGYLRDGLEGVKAGWHALRVAASSVLYALLKPVDALVQALDFLYQKLTKRGPSQVAQFSAQYMREIEKDIKSSFEAAGDAALAMTGGKHSKAATQWLEQARATADAAATDIERNSRRMREGLRNAVDLEGMAKAEEAIARLHLEVSRFGMGEAAKAMADFAAIEGVTQEQLNRFRALRQHLDGLAQQRHVADAMAEVRREIEQFGMSETDRAIANFAALEGVTAQQVEAFARLRRELEGINREFDTTNRLAEKGKRVWEETRTPLERFEQEMEELRELLRAQAIDFQTFERAVNQAKERLEKATPKANMEEGLLREKRLATFIRAGSAEAMQYKFQMERNRDNPENKVPEKQLMEQKETNNLLSRINRRLDFERVAIYSY